MIKISISLFLTTVILLSNCTEEQEVTATKLWKESQSLFSKAKISRLKEAKRACGLPQIELDANIYIIDKILNKNGLSLKMVNKLVEKIDKLRSLNNNSHYIYKNDYAGKLDNLTKRLVVLKVKFETNKKKLYLLNSYLNSNKNDIKKGFSDGKSVPISINFENNQDSVIQNKNINILASAINDIIYKNRDSKFTITGYTSAKGDSSYNKKLSERRAVNTKKYIENRYPITMGHILTFGVGESDLICDNSFSEEINNGEYQCLNGDENEISSRRVEVIQR